MGRRAEACLVDQGHSTRSVRICLCLRETKKKEKLAKKKLYKVCVCVSQERWDRVENKKIKVEDGKESWDKSPVRATLSHSLLVSVIKQIRLKETEERIVRRKE